ncbi:MAG: hypothetical protein ACREVA_02275 [Burkholderiales bacterium]
MAAETYTNVPTKFFAGDYPVLLTETGTIVAGQNLVARSFVASDVTGKWIVHPGFDVVSAVISPLTTVKIVGILQDAVDATAADMNGRVWNSICVFADQLVWPANVNTNLLKTKFLEETNIKVVFQLTGQV